LGWSVPIELLVGSAVSISYQTDKSSSVCQCILYLEYHFIVKIVKTIAQLWLTCCLNACMNVFAS